MTFTTVIAISALVIIAINDITSPHQNVTHTGDDS